MMRQAGGPGGPPFFGSSSIAGEGGADFEEEVFLVAVA
ncbi:hypothetical protein L495_1141, partial [Bordetella bronchiseptica CARE970018BB]